MHTGSLPTENRAARAELLTDLRQRPSGRAWAARHTDLVDAAVRAAAEALGLARSDANLAIVATGGYGRRELSPHSDVDLTVVPIDDAAPDLDAQVRDLYRRLNAAIVDDLGLELGYAYRLVSDAPGLDARTQTGLLDARLVAGNPLALARLTESLEANFSPGEFLLAKIAERAAAEARTHDTPAVTEPHLKEGAGGLRSLHAATWIGYGLGERPHRGGDAYETVLLARNLLHLVADRHQDVLSRARQGEVADLLREDPLVTMARLLAAMRELHGGYLRSLERIGRADFTLGSGALASGGEVRPIPGSDAARCAVGVALAHRLNLRVAEFPVPVAPTGDGPAILYALSHGEGALRDFDRCGLLAFLLPELEAVRDLIPADGIHRYTVWEHSLRAVRAMDAITDPMLLGIVQAIPERGVLVLALLLHDCGKIDLDGPHSEIGAELAEIACTRLGLPSEATATVVWLVREHLSMVRFLRLRDVAQPTTIAEFTALVGTRERLDLLTLLSYCDVTAVSPETWTPAQDAYLRELYLRTAEVLSDGLPAVDPEIARRRVRRQIARADEDPAETAAFVDRLPAHYLVSTPSNLIALHREFVARATRGHPTVAVEPRPGLGASEFTICAADRPRLLQTLLAAFYAYDLGVPGYRIATTRDEPAIALDVFTVTHGGHPVPEATAAAVSDALARLLRDELDADALLTSRGKDPNRRAKVLQWSFSPGREGTPSILDVRSPRGRGLPYRLARWIAEQDWDVTSARLGQWGANVAAAFSIDRPENLDEAIVAEAVRRLGEDG